MCLVFYQLIRIKDFLLYEIVKKNFLDANRFSVKGRISWKLEDNIRNSFISWLVSRKFFFYERRSISYKPQKKMYDGGIQTSNYICLILL